MEAYSTEFPRLTGDEGKQLGFIQLIMLTPVNRLKQNTNDVSFLKTFSSMVYGYFTLELIPSTLLALPRVIRAQ